MACNAEAPCFESRPLMTSPACIPSRTRSGLRSASAAGMSPRGELPLGTQFVGRIGDEATLLQLAGQLEVALPWRARRPPVSL